MLPSNVQLAIGAALLALGFGVGWQVNNWRHDSIALVSEKSAQRVATMAQESIASAAAELELKIASGVMTQRIIERGVIKEIRTNETIYRNMCIADAGRMFINDAARGRVSSKPIAAMP